MKKIYIICTLIVALGIAGGVSFFVYRDHQATIPDDIKLITMHNKEYHFAKSEKKLKLVEFLYLHCPDICPTTTQKMNLLKKDLEKAGVYGDKVQFLTITIDPYRDTPEKLREYMEIFEIEDDGNWIFLTGDRENIKEDLKDIEKVGKTFQFLYRDPGDGFYVHSTFVFLIDENNKFIKKFPMGEDFNKEKVYKKIMDNL